MLNSAKSPHSELSPRSRSLGEMRRRFLHAHRLAGRIEETEFVECIVADAFPREVDAVFLDDVRVLRDVRMDVGDASARGT